MIYISNYSQNKIAKITDNLTGAIDFKIIPNQKSVTNQPYFIT